MTGKLLGKGNLFLLAEQVASSLFNFLIVVYLSNHQSDYVEAYGVAFTLYLVISGFVRNSVVNPFLVGTNIQLPYILSISLNAFKNPFFYVPVIIAMGYSLIGNTLLISVSVMSVFVFIDLLRAYLVSNNQQAKLFAAVLFIYSYLALATALGSVVFSYISLAGVLLLLAIFLILKNKRLASAAQTKVDGKSAFMLSATYSVYTHSPILIAGIFLPGAAAGMVLVRSVFQPMQIFSRFVDIIEKRSFSSIDASNQVEMAKKRVKLCLIISTSAALLIAIFCYFFFENIFNKPLDGTVVIYIVLYALMNVFLFSVKPVETFFFKKSSVAQIVKSRIVVASLFVSVSVLSGYLWKDHISVVVLAASAAAWFLSLALNYSKLVTTADANS